MTGVLRTIVLVCLLISSSAQAIPAFARRYRTACTTCHVLPPQLNSFGRAFRANGYRMPSGEGVDGDIDRRGGGGFRPDEPRARIRGGENE